MGKIFDFQESLKKGKKAEKEFYELFKDKLEQLDGYVADFKIKRTGKIIELKTDSYDPTKTPNFFIERYSYGDEAGGPFQSLKKGVDYYVYWFPITMEFFVFKVDTLVKKLEEDYADSYLLNIYNKSHITRGMLIERADLSKINIKIEDIL